MPRRKGSRQEAPDEGALLRSRSLQAWHERGQGLFGATAAAVADVARRPTEYGDGEVLTIFWMAMGWPEAEARARAKYGGHWPRDPRSGPSERHLARLYGAAAKGRRLKDNNKFQEVAVWRRSVAGEVGANPTLGTQATVARELCRELAIGFEEYARGDYVSARSRRASAVKRWNRVVRGLGVENVLYTLLCEHCGMPMVFVADERIERGLSGPAKVHPDCKPAFRATAARESTR